MKLKAKFSFILISLFLLTAPLFSADLRATVNEISGKVDYKTQGGDWTPLSVGDTLNPGDSISTGFNAKAVLILGDTSVLVANALTRLTLSELAEKEGTVTTDLFLDVGNVRAEVHSSDEVSNDFQIRNANSTASVRGTVLDVEILGDGRGMRVMAWDGMAEVKDLRTGKKAKVGEEKKKKDEGGDEEGDSEDEEAADEEGSQDDGSADGEDSGDSGSDSGDTGSDGGSSAPAFEAPPEPPAQIAAAPLMASGTGGGMVSPMTTAIAATTVTVSTKPPAPTSISTGGGGSAATETTAAVTTTEEIISTTTVVPTTSSVNIQVTWPE